MCWQTDELRYPELTHLKARGGVGRDSCRHIPSLQEVAVYKSILIATDGSELADKAVTQGLTLAKAVGAKVIVLTATEPWTAMVSGEAVIAFPTDEYDKATAEHARMTLSGPEKQAKALGVPCEVIHAKDTFPADAIVAMAKSRKCDLIVMASHGRRGMSRLLLGSQANKVVTHSEVPVLVCR